MAVTAVGCKCNRWTAEIQQELCSFSFSCFTDSNAGCSKDLIHVTKQKERWCLAFIKSVGDHCWAPINTCMLWAENKSIRILCGWESQSFSSLFLFLGRNLSGKAACTSSLKKVYSSGCSFWWVLLLLSYSVQSLQDKAVVKVFLCACDGNQQS